MKLCPKCELNYINDNDELCTVCKVPSKTLSGDSQMHKTRTSVYFNEDFTFVNEMYAYRGKIGYKAFNFDGDNVGIVFMTGDKRSPSFGHCELCIYPTYQSRYGEWHRFTSYGCRLQWEVLCNRLKTNSSYKCHID